MTLQFRPHHYLCALGFRGKGYSPSFVANFQEIVNRLRGPGGDQINIQTVPYTDSICAPCPNRQELSCLEQKKISMLDQAHFEALEINEGQQLTWGEAKQRIKDKIDLKVFHRICKGCNWKALGICETALNELRNETH